MPNTTQQEGESRRRLSGDQHGGKPHVPCRAVACCIIHRLFFAEDNTKLDGPRALVNTQTNANSQ